MTGAALPERLPEGGPKGQALREVLEAHLARLPPGSPLPSERELAERYGLARMTVRTEIERLAAEGLVYRLQGRGTFVAEPRVAQAQAFSSFTEDMLARGFEPGSIVRSVTVGAPDAAIAAALERGPGDPVVRLDRVRTADGQPMALEEAYLPLQRYPGIDEVDFTHASLFTVLGERFGVRLDGAEQRVVAVRIDGDAAGVLRVEPGDPGLRFETLARDDGGVPVYFAVSLFPADRYEIRLRQTRPAGGVA
ncbi:MAG TPA: GntR family transcriptional regulator [Capillimicrobium sp.]|nr:GntR family transcriptional regulator [Capillimicrobium sp.]